MTITNGYCTLAELKARLNVTTVDATRDGYMEQMIEAASRWIDEWTGREFFATTATRYFTADNAGRLSVLDLLSVTTLKSDEDGDRTYETTWSATDFDLMPYNNTPYQWIEVTPNGVNLFPAVRRGIEIAGSWGYTATTPLAVHEACLLYSARLYKRKDAVLGVAGQTTLGTITTRTPEDKDVQRLLMAYVRLTL